MDKELCLVASNPPPSSYTKFQGVQGINKISRKESEKLYLHPHYNYMDFGCVLVYISSNSSEDGHPSFQQHKHVVKN